MEPTDVLLGIDLYEAYDPLDARDAVFAAVALNRGIDAVLSPDRAFDGVAELRRLDPADAAAVASLSG